MLPELLLGRRGGARLFLLATALSAGSGGCAYYNVLYNAKQKYREAQDVRAQALLADPERTKIGSQEDRLYQDAFEKAAKVVRFYPKSKWVDDALLLMGAASLEKGDYATAIRKCDEIMAIFPNSDIVPDALLVKGRAHVETKEYGEARESLALAAERKEKRIQDDVLYFQGVVDQREGRLEEARAAYDTVLEKHRKSEWLAEAGLALGEMNLEANDLEGAIRAFERVRRRAKTSDERFQGGLQKGNALLADRQFDRARTTFRDLAKGAANEKERGKALVLLGKATQASGDPAGAFRTYKEILDKMPRTEAAAEAQLEIARSLDEARKYDLAKEEYQRVNEQGTGFEAWRTASTRITEIQKLLDLRDGIVNDDEKPEERLRKRYLLAEHLLEKMNDESAALDEYASLARDARGEEIGAQALYAQAWLYEHRFDRPDTAESLLYQLIHDYRNGPEVVSSARRRFGLPVWKIERLDLPKPKVISTGPAEKPKDAVLKRVEPREARLPEGVSQAKVWVRVMIGDSGKPTSVKVSKSGGEDVDAAALEAAEASEFLPPSQGGPAVTVLEYIFPPLAKAPPPSGAPPGAPGGAGAAGSTSPDGTMTPGAQGGVLEENPEGEPIPSRLPLVPGISVLDSAGVAVDSTAAPADSTRKRAIEKPSALRDKPLDPSSGD